MLEKPVNKRKTAFFCEALGVSRQGYYEYRKNRDKPYRYALLAAEMREIIAEDTCNDTYGYKRMYYALKFRESQRAQRAKSANSKASCVGGAEPGIAGNPAIAAIPGFPAIPCERTVYRIMQHESLIHKPKRVPNGITKADKEAMKSDDLFKRDFTSDAPNVKAVTDITEIPCAHDRKLYVSGLFDCYDLYPLAITMDDNMRAQLCVRMIKDAAKTHRLRGLTAHSDRGSQYTSREYRRMLKKCGIKQSMNSAGGRCHDNARCESVWARFKEECLYNRIDTKTMDIEDVKAIVWRYFMSYWANRRICSSIGGIPPAEKRRRFFSDLSQPHAA